MIPCQPCFLAASSTRLDLPESAAHVSRVSAQQAGTRYSDAGNALGCDSAAPRHRVERDSLSEQEASCGASDGRDFDLGSVFGRSDGVTFLQVPFDAVSPVSEWSELGRFRDQTEERRGDGRAAELGKDFVDERYAGQDALDSQGTSMSASRSTRPSSESMNARRSCPTRSLPLAPLRQRNRHSRTRACLRRASR